jgi:peptidyl-prolyl cis-trans isomerase C
MMPFVRFVHPALAPSATQRAGRLCVVAACLLVFAAPVRAQDADPVVARVNGAEIRASDVAIAEEEMGQSLAQVPVEARREYVVTYLSDTLLVAQAADAKKLADTADFKRRLAYARNRLLSETLLAQETKAALTEPAMRAVYDDAVKQMGAEKEVRARHILLETEDEAKAALAEVNKGGDFAELAKQKSKDPGASEGGDLGFFTKDQMVPEFSEVAFKLEPGKVSDPVKSQFGWHIIKVEERRDRPVPEYDKVKEQIETYLARKSQSEMVTKLRADAKIERVEAKAPVAPPPGAEPKK